MNPSFRLLRLGSVSYLNARPLIHGLDRQPDLRLSLDVPARLLEGLSSHQFDVALLPIIDYQRLPNLKALTSGAIGCDGPTLTVRVFSPKPIAQMTTLACDRESHTSVALAKIILAEKFGLRPQFVDLTAAAASDGVARLLIGDKVVCQEPAGMPHQIDLGSAWKELTGRPFVFAMWIARDGIDLRDLPERLSKARREGMNHLDEIIARHATPYGWPPQLARQYLTEYLKFDVGDAQLEAIRLFYELAHKHGVIATPRGLELYERALSDRPAICP